MSVMLDLEGLALSQEEKELLAHPHLRGVILFSRNYESRIQVRSLIETIRAINSTLLVAVDQEGGRIQRFQKDFTKLPALEEFGKIFDKDPHEAKEKTRYFAQIMVNELLNVGVDFSFTPVLDVNRGISRVIGNRSFHGNPQVVAALGDVYIKAMSDANMIAVGKHFPGHGAVALDSHQALPIDERDYSVIDAEDLLPFKQAIKTGIAAIMSAHIVYPDVDDQPATFSKVWLQDILRNKLHFKGIVFSDDLNMKAASAMGDFDDRAEAAFEAGCDTVLICNHREGAIKILDSL